MLLVRFRFVCRVSFDVLFVTSTVDCVIRWLLVSLSTDLGLQQRFSYKSKALGLPARREDCFVSIKIQ